MGPLIIFVRSIVYSTSSLFLMTPIQNDSKVTPILKCSNIIINLGLKSFISYAVHKTESVSFVHEKDQHMACDPVQCRYTSHQNLLPNALNMHMCVIRVWSPLVQFFKKLYCGVFFVKFVLKYGSELIVSFLYKCSTLLSLLSVMFCSWNSLNVKFLN